jgi:hypothetical protein
MQGPPRHPKAQLRGLAGVLAILCGLAVTERVGAATVSVSPGASIQAAIAAAAPGDIIEVAAGTFTENIDFQGKAVTVRGSGDETVLRGTGAGPVVTLASGEGMGSVLDSVTVTGGRADRGGGIAIVDASPVIVRAVIIENRASQQGSGVLIAGNSTARLYNSVIAYNRRDGSGDPHGVEVVDASPTLVNNTIVRGDSNGIVARGTAAPVIMNNVIAFNGARVAGERRGRGICDFSGGRAVIQYNDFHKNRIAALLRDGRDWRKIRAFQRRAGDLLIVGNIDAAPGFRRRPRRRAAAARISDMLLRRRRARARDRGNPDPACNDLDGTRNTMGFTGGPFAPGSSAVPGAAACGAP